MSAGTGDGGGEERMITQCSYCQIDTAGNHKYGCPCRQVNFPDDRTDFEKQINFHMHEATGDKPQPQVAPTRGLTERIE